MPKGVIYVTIDGALQLRALAERLKAAGPQGKQLQKQMRRQIRVAGGPAVRSVKAAVEAIPVTGVGGGGTAVRSEHAASRARTERGRAALRRRGGGLRRTISRAIRILQRPTGIRIEVNGSRLPPGQRNLPRDLDSRRGWLHPLFGDREKLYAQFGESWWYSNLIKHAPAFRRGINQAIADTLREIEG